jgi:enoyl-CoA hydratase
VTGCLPVPSTSDTHVLVIDDPRPGVRRLTLNRPHRHNALSHELAAALLAAFETVEQDDRVRVVVLRGAGRSFCAGADLDEHFIAHSIAAESRPDIGSSGLWERIEQLRVPVIAAVQGWAVTGGFLLAYCCDLIVAAESARFRDTHAALGLLPTGGESQRLPRLVGLALARELMLTSRPLPADEALRAGLVSRVVPDADLDDAALSLAEQVSAGSPRSVRAMKRLINDGARPGFADSLALESELNSNGAANEVPDPEREERLRRFRETGRI